ncbi:MAG: hypothetical protein RIM84_05280 [Alphaproteobacteria bacterium]
MSHGWLWLSLPVALVCAAPLAFAIVGAAIGLLGATGASIVIFVWKA